MNKPKEHWFIILLAITLFILPGSMILLIIYKFIKGFNII